MNKRNNKSEAIGKGMTWKNLRDIIGKDLSDDTVINFIDIKSMHIEVAVCLDGTVSIYDKRQIKF